jgi:hypothetical protein
VGDVDGEDGGVETEPLYDSTTSEIHQVVACEPVVSAEGFVLCHEIGATAVLHVHDHRNGPNPIPVAFIVRTDRAWATHAGRDTIQREGIVEAFEEWVKAQLTTKASH